MATNTTNSITGLEGHSVGMINNSQQLGEREDTQWVRQSMLIANRGTFPKVNNRNTDQQYATQFSYQRLNFADTSLGGNRAMNPRPQFTRFADPKLPSLLMPIDDSNANVGSGGTPRSLGMGRYYAETVNQNANLISLQFGVPAYNSLTNFFTSFYDSGHGAMVNDGIVNNVAFTIGKWVGYITMWAILPEVCAANILYNTGKKALADIQRRPLSKFYYMKPTMGLYWSTVTTIVNALTVNMHLANGLAPGVLKRTNPGTNNSLPSGDITIDTTAVGQSQDDIEQLARILPDIWLTDNKGFNIRAIANRYERLADAHDRILNDIRNQYPNEADAFAAIQNYAQNGIIDSGALQKLNYPTMTEYLTEYIDSVAGKGISLFQDVVSVGQDVPANKQGDNSADVQNQANSASIAANSVSFEGKNLWTGIFDHLSQYAPYATAELRDGSAFVHFYVDWESHVSESFNNSTKESSISETMNSTARAGRDKTFNFAHGNLGDNVIADAVESIISSVGDVLSGLASSVGLSGLAMLGGRTFVDIPEYWDQSTCTLPSSNYTIQLRSWAGNSISVMTNVLIPLAMWIAAAAPRATGRNSYSGPFLCKLWQKGRVQIQLGIINSLSITRGTGNVGWNLLGQPTGVDLNIGIINLSKMLYVPITTDLTVSDFIGLTLFDEDTNFTDYMAILGSLGLSEQYYASSRWRLRRARINQRFDTFFTVDNFETYLYGNTTVGSIMSIAVRSGHI